MIVNESKKILKKKFTIFKFWINFQYLLKVITLAEKNIASGVSDSSVEQMDKLLFLLLHKLDNLEKSKARIDYMHVFFVLLKWLTDKHQQPQKYLFQG